MPSQYAHYRFGQQSLQTLPKEVRQQVQQFRRFYDMGQQGPDFFFYHNPLWKTSAGELGARFHKMTGREFFTQACAQANSEAALAYLLGVLGHFCLDSLCHPYVNRVDAAGELRHVAMEKEFDRLLMEKDKLPSPHTQDLGEKLHLTRGECVTVASLYPPATAGQVNQSVRNMRWCLRFLAGKNRDRREKLLKSIKPSLAEHLIPEEADDRYVRSNSELLVRYKWAMEKYAQMSLQLLAYKNRGEELGEDFDEVFG